MFNWIARNSKETESEQVTTILSVAYVIYAIQLNSQYHNSIEYKFSEPSFFLMLYVFVRLMTPPPVLTSQIRCLPSTPHVDSSIDSSLILTEKFGVLVGLTRNQGENVIIWKKFWKKIKKLTKFVILMDVRIAV